MMRRSIGKLRSTGAWHPFTIEKLYGLCTLTLIETYLRLLNTETRCPSSVSAIKGKAGLFGSPLCFVQTSRLSIFGGLQPIL